MSEKKTPTKSRHWVITYFDHGITYGPYNLSLPYPATEVEAAWVGMTGKRKEGFSLGTSFLAVPIKNPDNQEDL